MTKKQLSKKSSSLPAKKASIQLKVKKAPSSRAKPKKVPALSASKAKVLRNSSKKPASKVKFTLEKLVESVASLFSTTPKNIAAAIKIDHEALRSYLSLLKDTHADLGERRRAYTHFSALLKSHSTTEEDALYQFANKMADREIHIKIAEGFVEHHLANHLMARIEKASDPLEWSAHVNVLSEIIAHHLDEEERDLLPMIHRETSVAFDREMLELYLKLRVSNLKGETTKSKEA